MFLYIIQGVKKIYLKVKNCRIYSDRENELNKKDEPKDESKILNLKYQFGDVKFVDIYGRENPQEFVQFVK